MITLVNKKNYITLLQLTKRIIMTKALFIGFTFNTTATAHETQKIKFTAVIEDKSASFKRRERLHFKKTHKHL
jgi:hypothetical protein